MMSLAEAMRSNWKLLTNVKYKEYNIVVKGSYELEEDGFECIYLTIDILDKYNVKIKSYSYLDEYYIEGNSLVICPRLKYTKKFLGFKYSPVKTSIQEAYIVYMEKVIEAMKYEVDDLITEIDLDKYNKEMTEGLPDSIFKQ